MSEFETSIQGMKRVAQDEASLVRKLQQIENEINQILSSPAVKYSEIERIRRALRNNMQGVKNNRDKLNAMSSALLEIVQLYQSTENEIAGSHGGHQTVSDAVQRTVQNIWHEIQDISKNLGMNLCAAYSKDPVNLCNGNYVYEKVCMELNTEMEMQFRIFYNIQNDMERSLGRGWIHE